MTTAITKVAVGLAASANIGVEAALCPEGQQVLTISMG